MVHYTRTIGGKRKIETYNLDQASGQKFSKDKEGNPVLQSVLTDAYEDYATEQRNLENMR